MNLQYKLISFFNTYFLLQKSYTCLVCGDITFPTRMKCYNHVVEQHSGVSWKGVRCCKVFYRNTPGNGPCHNQKEDYIRFVQMTGARRAEAEKVLSEFKLKVPSLIRGTGHIQTDVKRLEDHDATRRIATRPAPVFSGKRLPELQANEDNWKRAKKSLSLSSSSASSDKSSSSSKSSNSSIVKVPNVSVLEPEKDHPKSTTQQIEEIYTEKIELIEINVGGKFFITTKPTIENTNIKYSYLIDRDPTYFDIILNHIRYQQQKCHISLDVFPNTRRELACISIEAKFY